MILQNCSDVQSERVRNQFIPMQTCQVDFVLHCYFPWVSSRGYSSGFRTPFVSVCWGISSTPRFQLENQSADQLVPYYSLCKISPPASLSEMQLFITKNSWSLWTSTWKRGAASSTLTLIFCERFSTQTQWPLSPHCCHCWHGAQCSDTPHW